MINLRNSPFLGFALLLLLAYGCFNLLNIKSSEILVLILGLIFLTSAVVSMLKYQSRKLTIATLTISLCLICAGGLRYMTYSNSLFPIPEEYEAGNITAELEVRQVLKVRSESTTLQCEVTKLWYADSTNSAEIRDKYLLIRIKGKEQQQLYPGSRLKATGYLKPMKGPLNPHAFDLRDYYKTLGIRHQVSCRDSNIAVYEYEAFNLMRVVTQWQSKLCGIISLNTSPSVAQVTNALVFGQRSAMDEEIRNAFANAGAMHVLSVSGMHMAIVYSMLYVILGAPGVGKFSRRVVRLILYALGITIYVGITGASPAVLRAGLMILLYLLGKSMGWNTQIWNLLGFAAFVMLWNNPFIWLNIGFQLSFLAMAGILLFAKPIIRYFTFKNIILHRVWEVTAVSISAQAFIIPIILHQFYQMPLTFILSSLVAMPASYVIIFGALVNIVLSPFHLDWLWQLYDKAGQIFLNVMKWLANLNPDMNFSLPVVPEVLMLLAAFMFAVGLIYHWPKGKAIALSLSLAALLTLTWHRTQQWTTNDLTIYHNYSGLVMDLFFNGHCVTIQDSAVSDRQVTYSTRGHRVYRDVIRVHQLKPDQTLTRANFHFSNLGFYSSSLGFTIWNGNIKSTDADTHASYVLVNKCPDMEELHKFLHNKRNSYLILPAHLPWKQKHQIRNFLFENDYPFWDIAEKGFFKLTL